MTRQLRTPDEIARLRARSTDPAFAAAWHGLTERAEVAFAQRLLPPVDGGGWGHHYYCPDHSEPLLFDPAAPGEHRCPVDGERVVGEHMDRAWRSRLSNEALDGARACAQMWLATEDDRLLEHARDVLLRYADLYPNIAPHGDIVGLGRVHGTALEESVWGIGLAELADDIRPALGAVDRARVDTLLHQVLDQVRAELMGKIHNIECWHLASRITLATVLDRPDEVEESLAGEFGLHAQLAAGIRDDGWWSEGSPHYHFYMLRAVAVACVALRTSHPSVVASHRLRGMVETPLTMLRPDLSLAALNDGWFDIAEPLGATQYASLFELAWALWRTPAAAAMLGASYTAGAPRDAVEALLYGPDPEELAGDPLPPTRAVHPASGYAVVDDGERSLLLKFGPHGGGHGHPDKLQIDLQVRGVRVAPDLGSPAYNSPLQGPWIRQTLSHNTATVGGVSQPPATGVLLSAPHDARGPEPLVLDAGVTWSATSSADHGSWLLEPRYPFPPGYESASMRRLVLWSPHGYLVDVFAASVPSGERLDLAWRLRGTATVDGGAAPSRWQPLGETQASYLSEIRALPEGACEIAWEVEGERTRLWCLGPGHAQNLLARCPGAFVEEEQTMLLRSCQESENVLVTVVATSPQVLGANMDDGLLHVHRAGATDTWELADGSGPATSVTTTVDRMVVDVTPWLVPLTWRLA